MSSSCAQPVRAVTRVDVLSGTEPRASAKCDHVLARLLAVLLIAASGGAASAAQPPCPDRSATVEVYVDNRSADSVLTVNISGELLDPSATCTGVGTTLYAGTFTCNGVGLVHCGKMTGLRPGAWVNHLTVTVAGSAPQ